MDLQSRVAAGFARVVAAINVVDTKVESLPDAAAINDAATNATSVWSSSKTQAQINAAITALINGADASQDTLLELANSIAALAQADAGLVSAAAVQVFNTAQKLQACQNIGIGDPDHDYTTAIAAGLNAGL